MHSQDPARWRRPAPFSAAAGRASLLFFGVFLVLLLLGDGMLQDPDTYWHIAVGRRIWDTGRLPRVDEFSHTFAGSPWIAKEWLSQALLFGAHQGGGWRGVVLLAAAMAAASTALLFAFLERSLTPAIALVLALLALSLAGGHFLARPHILVLPLLTVWVGALVRAAERGAGPSWGLVPLMALWANLHPSFPIALALAAPLGLEAVAAAPAPDRVRTAGRWIAFGAACLAAAGATPYGFAIVRIAFRFAGSDEPTLHITEWRPLPPDGEGAYALVLLLGSLAVLASSRTNPLRILPVALCAYLMFRHARFAGHFGVVAALAVAGPLARRVPAFSARPDERAANPASAAGLAVAAALSVALAATLQPRPGAANSPAAALEAARRFGAAGPVFNEYDFGGYLIAEGVPTFVDGRTDQLFLDGFRTAIHDALSSAGDDGFRALLRRHDVGWAIVRTGSRAATKLDAAAGWQRIHQDAVAAAYVRTVP